MSASYLWIMQPNQSLDLAALVVAAAMTTWLTITHHRIKRLTRARNSCSTQKSSAGRSQPG
jgi:hypothetical protein